MCRRRKRAPLGRAERGDHPRIDGMEREENEIHYNSSTPDFSSSPEKSNRPDSHRFGTLNTHTLLERFFCITLFPGKNRRKLAKHSKKHFFSLTRLKIVPLVINEQFDMQHQQKRQQPN